jgi:crossover junction endodeoxyribonuclease RusA
MVESSSKVKPWREAVKFAAREVFGGTPEMLRGPVEVRIVFTLPRPKSSPKRRKYPDKTPDLDKCLRSTFDALTQAGVWEDDSRVVRCQASKVFPNSAVDALDVPGCVIEIDQLDA